MISKKYGVSITVPSNSVYIVLKNYNNRTRLRQPWYTASYLITKLEMAGKKVTVVDALDDLVDVKDSIILKFFSISDVVKPSKSIIVDNKFVFIMSFPILRVKDLLSIRGRTLLSHFMEFHRILIFSLFFKRIFLLTANKKNITYWCLSDYMQKLLSDNGFTTQRFIPYIDDLKPGTIKNRLSGSEVIGFGYVGPAYFSRCFDVAIRVLSKLSNHHKGINSYLLMRNESKKTEKFTKELLDRYPIQRLCLKMGMLSRSELNEIMEKIDVLIIPFDLVMSELPIVCLEALRLGKVVITSKSCGIQDIFADFANFNVVDSPQEVFKICEKIVSNGNFESANCGIQFSTISDINSCALRSL